MLRGVVRCGAAPAAAAAAAAARALVSTGVSRGVAGWAVQYEKHGDPEKVLRCVATEDGAAALGPRDVRLRMVCAPINPADLNMVEGTYGVLAEQLPAVAGNEGVGEVLEVGAKVARDEAVHGIAVGARAVPGVPGLGTWRTELVTSVDNLLPVAADVQAPYSATVTVNPSAAYRMLTDFVQLKPGDWVIQDGANSVVGQSVICLANEMGLNTINIMRYRRKQADMCDHLHSLGADIVTQEGVVNSSSFTDMVEDIGRENIKLALNCSSGRTATDMVRALAPGGTLVTYGGMAKKPLTLPAEVLIERNIQCKGFWLSEWNKHAARDDRLGMINYLTDLARANRLAYLMETHDIDDFDYALERSLETFYSRKVLLNMSNRPIDLAAEDYQDADVERFYGGRGVPTRDGDIDERDDPMKLQRRS